MLEQVGNNHTGAQQVIDTIDGVAVATREHFDKIAFENGNTIESFRLMNSFIVGADYQGGMNETWSPNTVSQYNPAGSFRTLLTPKGQTDEMPVIRSLGDINFNEFHTGAIVLHIDTYIRSGDPKQISKLDSGGWLVSTIEGAVVTQAYQAIIRTLNYKTYRTLKQGALDQIDPWLGAQGRVKQASTDPEQFTNDFIDDIAAMGALPHDMYVTGFDASELIAVLSPSAKAKLLKEKLVIYDGQFMGQDGKFFTGLPNTFMFDGVPLYTTKFLNDGQTEDFDYILLPKNGMWSPYLFYQARIAGLAELIPFSDQQVGIYATEVHGMKVERELDQYITARTVNAPQPSYSTNLVGLKITPSAGTFTISFDTEASVGDIIYRVTRIDAETTGKAWSAPITGATDVSMDVDGTGLIAGKEYRIEVAASQTGQGTPDLALGKSDYPFIITKLALAK